MRKKRFLVASVQMENITRLSDVFSFFSTISFFIDT